jgi:hypothetical protein
MTNEQPEALRLAAALDALLGYRGINADVGKAAAELRRLQSVETESKERILRLEGALVKEVAINAQLLEALEFISDRQNLMFAECSDAEEIIDVARAAIAAAKGGA